METEVKPFVDLKVAGIMADDAACGHYRIKFPLEFLQRGGATVEIYAKFAGVLLREYDVILAQRQHAEDIYEMLVHAKWMGKTIIYEIDDNVHSIHRNSVVFHSYRPGSETLHNVAKFIGACDGLFTTSPELASQYSLYSKRTWVLPNCIDFEYRDWDTPVPRDPRLEGKVVIGWAGSITHQDDWQPLVGVLDKVLDKYPNAVIALVSAYQTMDTFVENLKIPADRIVRLDPVPFEQYPALPAQFDIGLVPVINTTFNRAKSDLKIKEYGARGVPYVASSIAPYLRFHLESGGQGGYICNTPQEWVDAISTMVEDSEERKQRSQFIETYIRENCSMKGNAWKWAEAIRDARATAKIAPEAVRKYEVREKPGRNDPCPCGSGVKYKKCHNGAWG